MKGSLWNFVPRWRPNEKKVDHRNVNETRKEIVDHDLLPSGQMCCFHLLQGLNISEMCGVAWCDLCHGDSKITNSLVFL